MHSYLFETLVLLFSIIMGFIFSYVPTLPPIFESFEEPLLMLLLFFIFLEIDFSKFKVALKNKKFLFAVLIINFLITPLLAFLISLFIPEESIFVRIALVILLVMPCTDWYIVFTDMAHGNTTLSLSVLPFNLILQLVLLPVYLYFFFGHEILTLDLTMSLELLSEVFIPLIAAFLVRVLILKGNYFQFLKKPILFLQKHAEIVLLCLIAFSIYVSEGQNLFEAPKYYLELLLAILAFYIIAFSISLAVSSILNFKAQDSISLIYSTTARNSPLALSLAPVLFPNLPMVTVALLIGPLTELPFSMIELVILNKIFNKESTKPLTS